MKIRVLFTIQCCNKKTGKMRCLLPGEKVWKDDCPTRATTQQGEFSTLTKEELETNPFRILRSMQMEYSV